MSGARIARQHHIEGIHRLEVPTLAEVERAGGDHHLVDSGSPFAHVDGEVGELAGIGRQRIVIVADKGGLERHVARHG